LISAEVGFEGQLEYDSTKPDGTPRKLMDTSKINELGWKFKITIENGIESTVKEFIYTDLKQDNIKEAKNEF